MKMNELYELVNPSDPYTFEAVDLQVACMVALLVGSGHYDATRISDGQSAGALVFLTPSDRQESAIEQQLGMPISEFFETRRSDLIAAFESFLIGTPVRRKQFLRDLEDVKPKSKEKFIARYKDEQRSSMNNIGERAEQILEQLKRMENK